VDAELVLVGEDDLELEPGRQRSEGMPTDARFPAVAAAQKTEEILRHNRDSWERLPALARALWLIAIAACEPLLSLSVFR
jgi:hypothetical protein